MAVHTELGKLGEELAVSYLTQKGYAVLHRNWRYARFELDIIAEKNDILHFVEVKLRSSSEGPAPEENVTKKKIEFLLRAVDQFLFLHPQYKHFQLDILSITRTGDQEAAYFMIEDIYV